MGESSLPVCHAGGVRHALDLLVVTAFVLIGRATHEAGILATGSLQALWPFLLAVAVGWVASSSLRLKHEGLPAGALLWLITLVLGLGLRALSGQSTALPFVIVATLVVGAGLLGWRVVGILLRRGGTAPGP